MAILRHFTQKMTAWIRTLTQSEESVFCDWFKSFRYKNNRLKLAREAFGFGLFVANKRHETQRAIKTDPYCQEELRANEAMTSDKIKVLSKQLAADDRLWNTQQVVEESLIRFALKVKNIP